jgi:hypothetical protein
MVAPVERAKAKTKSKKQKAKRKHQAMAAGEGQAVTNRWAGIARLVSDSDCLSVGSS